jgi:hypothetical protein
MLLFTKSDGLIPVIILNYITVDCTVKVKLHTLELSIKNEIVVRQARERTTFVLPYYHRTECNRCETRRESAPEIPPACARLTTNLTNPGTDSTFPTT